MRLVNKEAARRHWDQIAATYSAHKEANRDYHSALKALFAAALPEAAHWRILEIGCGNGDVLRSLSPRCGLGVDFSEAMIAVARSRHAGCPNLEFRVGDADNLGADRPYDAVILPDLLEHVPEWSRTLAHAAELVRPGGRLALSTPNPLWTPALWVLEKLRLKTPEGPHRFVGLRAVVRHLHRLGLETVSVGNYLIIPKQFGRLTTSLNRACTGVPGLRGLGLVQFAVAQKRA